MIPEPHPDTLQAYHRIKAIQRGSRQAIEDKAIDAYHRALDEGKGREQAEEEYFSFFNKQSYERTTDA